MSVLGEHGLWVELHPFYRQLAMAQAHDLPVFRLRRDLEAVGQRRALDRERVVARRGEAIRNPSEHALAVVPHAGELAVHDVLRAPHFTSERLADRLVAEADTEDREFARKPR